MFYTVKLLNQEDIGGGRGRATYHVKDTCFEDNIELQFAGRFQEHESIEPVAVLTAYSRKKRNVARNLALYYVGVSDAPTYMKADKTFIDREFASFNYGKYTYRLVELYYADIKRAIDDYTRNEEALLAALKAARLKL